jgi:ABC-2 type transport system ATP-binding protein
MAVVLEFKNVSKRYHSRFASDERWALRDFSFRVDSGEIVGFLGPNGAGKTTALHIAVGFLQATSGHGTMMGASFGNAAVRRRIGFLAESPAFYHQSARKVLKFCGALNGVREPELSRRADELLTAVGLLDDGERNIGKFSRGMLQRVGVAQAFMNHPELLILDEPTSALDPISRLAIRKLLLQTREHGASVFLSSHQLSEVELICDRVAFLHAGRVIASGRTHDLLHKSTESEVIATRLTAAPAWARNIANDGSEFRFTVDAAKQRATIEHIWSSGGTLISVTPKTRSLEDLFVDLMQDSDSGERRQ